MKWKILLFILILSSCKQTELVYDENDQYLYLNIENNGKKIQWNKPFETILRFENINIDGLSILGPALGTKYVSENEIRIQMLCKKELAKEEDVKENHIKLKVSFEGKDKKRKTHTFIIEIE
jgi:hypothetical protein